MALKNYPSLERNIIFKTSIFRSKILVFQGSPSMVVCSSPPRPTRLRKDCWYVCSLWCSSGLLSRGLSQASLLGSQEILGVSPQKKPGESRLVVFRRETGKDIKNLLHPHFDEPKFIHGTGWGIIHVLTFEWSMLFLMLNMSRLSQVRSHTPRHHTWKVLESATRIHGIQQKTKPGVFYRQNLKVSRDSHMFFFGVGFSYVWYTVWNPMIVFFRIIGARPSSPPKRTAI